MYECVVTSDQSGQVIGVSTNNPEYGYIRVEHVKNEVTEGGWFRIARRSALIKGKVDELKTANFKAGDIIPGHIVVKESLEPFNPTNPEKDLKKAGETGVVCKYGEQPIYRNTFFTNDPYAEDTYIAHTNGEEIRAANESVKAIGEVLLNKLSERKATTDDTVVL